jgi:signal transduction histidine kinase
MPWASHGERIAVGAITVAGLAILVVALYAAVVGAGALAGVDEPRTSLTLAATALVAITFEPARRRLAKLAKLVVYGHRSSPWEAVSRLSAEMAHQQDPEAVLSTLAQMIRDGTGADRVVVWLRLDRILVPVAGSPGPLPTQAVDMSDDGIPDLGPVDLTVPIGHDDDMLGAVTVTVAPGTDPLLPIEVELVEDLAAAAWISIRTVHLQASLRRRLDIAHAQNRELSAARAATATAQLEERRRLERNLHDTCQQRAVALAGKFGLAASLAPNQPAEAWAVLSGVESDIDRLDAALRAVTQGRAAPGLLDVGIAAALRSQTCGLGVAVEVDDSGGRYPQEVEEAVFLCCTEAVQNAAKHAAASCVTVHLSEDTGRLEFSIRDDGIGFDADSDALPGSRIHAPGGGLHNMRERMRAVGGELRVRSWPGGTEITGRVPLMPGTGTA